MCIPKNEILLDINDQIRQNQTELVVTIKTIFHCQPKFLLNDPIQIVALHNNLGNKTVQTQLEANLNDFRTKIIRYIAYWSIGHLCINFLLQLWMAKTIPNIFLDENDDRLLYIAKKVIVNALEFGVLAISGTEVSVISYLKLPNHLLLHFWLHLSMEKIKIKPL